MTNYDNLEEFIVAPDGEGKYATTWKDKPHRLIYDLVKIAQAQRQDIRYLKAEKSSLEEDLENAVDRANRYEEKASRFEKADETLEAAWHVVFALEAALGMEKADEALEVFVLRRTVETFRDRARGTHPITRHADLISCKDLFK